MVRAFLRWTNHMEDLLGNAVAGLIAALTATFILGVGKWIRHRYSRYLDVKHIRHVVIRGRKRVMESKDVFNAGMGVTLQGDILRCAQYNLMIKELRAALENIESNLSYSQKGNIFDALDWFHTQSLHATKSSEGKPLFIDLPTGNWPTTEMRESYAKDKFQKLEAIKWLRLSPIRALASSFLRDIRLIGYRLCPTPAPPKSPVFLARRLKTSQSYKHPQSLSDSFPKAIQLPVCQPVC